jgi:hypothetical protein
VSAPTNPTVRGGPPNERLAATTVSGVDMPPRAKTARLTSTGVDSLSSLLRERDWQDVVVAYARIKGWLVYHTHDSRRSAPGFPDLAMTRGGRLVLAELKTETGRLRPEQARWIEALSAVRGMEVYLWRPSQWVDVRDALL